MAGRDAPSWINIQLRQEAKYAIQQLDADDAKMVQTKWSFIGTTRNQLKRKLDINDIILMYCRLLFI